MKRFEIGGCYFMLSFFDKDGRIPMVETYIYAGTNLMKADQSSSETTWYFKTPDGYIASGVKLEEENLQSFIRVGEDTVELVLDKTQLVQKLQEE
jgi:hypothetical protein